jgi:hypothetical protein
MLCSNEVKLLLPELEEPLLDCRKFWPMREVLSCGRSAGAALRIKVQEGRTVRTAYSSMKFGLSPANKMRKAKMRATMEHNAGKTGKSLIVEAVRF